MTRPRIRPDVAAALTAALPSRLVKKLDAEPALAERWTWTATTITTDKGETVTLTIEDGVAVAVACTCLLGPRCLHVGAVVALLEPAEAVAQVARAPIATVPVESAGADPAMVAAAARAFAVGADVLAAGAEASGAVAQAELLRAIHACRTVGLHRLASATTRVLRSIRELRADRPEFVLDVLARDLRESLVVAHAIARGDATAALVGTARRDYEPAGNLHLRGLFTEAIVARSGYAGAVTYLTDDRGRIYTRADVAPGDASRAAGAYDGSAAIGDAVLPHRELCRAGLFVSDATASADGRLGAGQRVRAVRAGEPSLWDAIAPRFATSLATQVAAMAVFDDAPDEQRVAGWDLVFATGTLVGPAGTGVGFEIDGPDGATGSLVTLVTVLDHRALPARDNLGVLGRGAGIRARIIARARLGAPHRLELLAIGPLAGEDRLVFPDAWHGRANLHYDRLGVPAPRGAPVKLATPPPAEDLLSSLRRRIDRVVQGGVGTLPTHALGEIDREARALAERALTAGAQALRELAAVAHDATRSATGTRRAIDRPAFARAWLRATLYETAARRRLSIAQWR